MLSKKAIASFKDEKLGEICTMRVLYGEILQIVWCCMGDRKKLYGGLSSDLPLSKCGTTVAVEP
jgi:hypothetical protein